MKKIIIIVSIVVTIIIACSFWISYTASHNSAMSSKKIADTIATSMNDLKINTAESKTANNQKGDADKLFLSKKYKDSSIAHKNVTDKMLSIMESYSEGKLNEVNKYGYNTKDIQEIFNTAKEQKEEEDKTNAATLYKSVAEKSQELINKHQTEVKRLTPIFTDKISKDIVIGVLDKDYKIFDITLFNDNSWAVATVQPLTFVTDNAKVVLQNINNSWRVVAGPGTSFSSEDFPNIPREVLSKLNS